jgi:NAD-dependent SIR2 family protein deacetylase
MESPVYTRWVKTLRCVSCNAPADDPHHPHGSGFKGMGTKVPDWWVIPICRTCHDVLHHDVHVWEEENGMQLEHVALTLLQAIREGVLHLGKQ